MQWPNAMPKRETRLITEPDRARLKLSLSRELEEMRDKVDEVDRLRKSLQSERDALMESKDDVGKNVSVM